MSVHEVSPSVSKKKKKKQKEKTQEMSRQVLFLTSPLVNVSVKETNKERVKRLNSGTLSVRTKKKKMEKQRADQ
jgi:hypothetical protein